jgi:outer membrane murein-binding lipoprotein Lpp
MKMTPGQERSRARQGSAWVRVPLVLAAAATAITLAGCSSGKPAYCTDRTNLTNSVKGLTSSGVSGLKSQLKQIQTDATTLVDSAKSDFPSETTAITSSVSALKNSVTALPSSPSAAQIATATRDAASVVSSVKSFVDASNSKCS